ncbi:hypothetical protein [Phyllobacterium myrsinacearum]|uniref:Uncharacterized protein n=1 Tax=Phyllobacterium myrsinacearum TaxID=28101 RepID=A0A839ENX3_9HYPH|nr:hypothetical protein [Phyllobacterium myrsinacearum]MBA8881781.1 hypothetical protein [Phyllobacterium myrsinacearum]
MYYGKIDVSKQWVGNKESSRQQPHGRSIVVIAPNKADGEALLSDAYGPFVSESDLNSAFFQGEPRDKIEGWLKAENGLAKTKETELLIAGNRLLKGISIIAILVQMDGENDPLQTLIRVKSGEQIKHLALEDLGTVQLFDLVETIEGLF